MSTTSNYIVLNISEVQNMTFFLCANQARLNKRFNKLSGLEIYHLPFGNQDCQDEAISVAAIYICGALEDKSTQFPLNSRWVNNLWNNEISISSA